MKLIIPGIPIAQIRMRLSSRNGFTRVYDPQEREKSKLKTLITQIFKGEQKFIHPRVSFVFHMPIIKSIPKKMMGLYESGLLKHEKKPDIDNLVKLYLDCMDNIMFEGDQKVMLGPCIKVYDPHPKTIIIVNEMSEILSPPEVDPMMWFSLFGKESDRCSSSEMASLPDSYTPTQLKISQSESEPSPDQTVDSLKIKSFVLQRPEQEHLFSSQHDHRA